MNPADRRIFLGAARPVSTALLRCPQRVQPGAGQELGAGQGRVGVGLGPPLVAQQVQQIVPVGLGEQQPAAGPGARRAAGTHRQAPARGHVQRAGPAPRHRDIARSGTGRLHPGQQNLQLRLLVQLHGPKGKSAPKEPPKGPELVTDPATLANFAVGVNYLQDAPMVPLRPDAEYPEWLFQMHLGPPKKLQELDPDSLQYWRRLRKHNSWQRNKLKKSRRL
uniref:Large ribosomal subunit protein mL54 n=1 Tax=Coturnix japonica TaxID=93934 RepID=A0A8C2T1R3_COTJA